MPTTAEVAVARAMCEALQGDPDAVLYEHDEDDGSDGVLVYAWEHYVDDAAVVLAALTPGFRWERGGKSYVVSPIDAVGLSLSESSLPWLMIKAGLSVLDTAASDRANGTPGETIDWDDSMVVVAVYRAMLAAASVEKTP